MSLFLCSQNIIKFSNACRCLKHLIMRLQQGQAIIELLAMRASSVSVQQGAGSEQEAVFFFVV